MESYIKNPTKNNFATHNVLIKQNMGKTVPYILLNILSLMHRKTFHGVKGVHIHSVSMG